MQSEIGQTIGRFQVREILGTGGYATVYRAQDTKLGRDVALKVLNPQLATNPAIVQRFQTEAQALARLHHPHLVTVHEVGESEDGRPYLVMELIQGQTLAQILAQGGPMPFNRAVGIVSQLASALDYMHSQQLVHRDVKPANVIIRPNGDAVLLDLGISGALADAGGPATTEAPIGTPAYMAPEQISGAPAGPPADIYALGVLAYELVAGHPPIAGDNATLAQAQVNAPPPPIESLNPNLPPPAATAIAQALAGDPAARPPTAAAFANLFAGNMPTEALPRSFAPAPVPVARPVIMGPGSSRWVIIAAVLGLAIAAVLLLLLLNRNGSQQPVVEPSAALSPTPANTLAPSPSPAPSPTPAPNTTPATAPSPPPPPPPPASAGTVPTVTAIGLPTVTSQAVPPDNRVASILQSLPTPGSSASFIDPQSNTEAPNSAQTPFAGGDTLHLILGEAVEQALSQGRVSATQPVTIQNTDAAGGSGGVQTQVGKNIALHDLLQATMASDDDTAANALLRTIGGPNAVNQEAQRLGLNQTRLAGPFKVSSSSTQGAQNTTSAHDLGLLMTEISEHRGVDPTSANDLFALLRLRQQQQPAIMGRNLSAGSVLAAVDGSQAGLSTEVALLQLGNGQDGVLALAIKGTSPADEQNQIATIAARVSQAFGP